jgi:hypothetical protein
MLMAKLCSIFSSCPRIIRTATSKTFIPSTYQWRATVKSLAGSKALPTPGLCLHLF